MTSVKRFFLGVAMIGSLVVGSFGIANAGVSIHGPIRWNESNYPGPSFTGYYSSNTYCWLSGFDVGSRWQGTLDQAYVYIGPVGEWYVSGAGVDFETHPSLSTWAEAYCVDLSSGGQNLFSPSTPIEMWACPSDNDWDFGGSCYTMNNGSLSYGNDVTWDVSPYHWNGSWNNMFAGIMGIGYDGLAHQQTFRYGVEVLLPHHITDYVSLATPGQVQPGMAAGNQIAWGGIWPINNNHLFCAQGSDSRCTGIAVSANSSEGTKVVAPAASYVCQLNLVETSTNDGEISARLFINTSNQWTLTVTGPSFGGKVTTAQAFCFPYPYSISTP